MAEYRVGVVGCGRRGKGVRWGQGGGAGVAEAHTIAYEACEKTEIVAACDILPEHLEGYAEEHNVPGRYTDYREMLEKEDLDIVSVATWHLTHAEITVAAAEAGVKGVWCEKPMALTLPECDDMLAACALNGVRLSVNHQRRLGEPYRIAKEIAYSGDIGELIRLEAYSGGTNLYDWGTHWIDMLFFYVNQTPVDWVTAMMDFRRPNVDRGMNAEDHAIVHYEFRNGIRAYLEIGMPVKGQPPNRLVGTEGFVELLSPSRANPDQATVRARVKGRGEFLIGDTTESIHAQANFGRALEDLIRAIEEGHESLLSGYRARATTEVIIAGYESVLRRGRVDLPLAIDYNPLAKLMEQIGRPDGPETRVCYSNRYL